MKQHFSLQVRLLLVTVFLAVPVILIIFWFGQRNHRTLLEGALAENQSEAEIMVSQLDTMLQMLENSLVNIALNDSDFKLVATAAEQDTEFWMTNRRLMESITNLEDVTSLDFTFFVYYPGSDIFYNYSVNSQMTEMIREMVQDSEGSLQTGWQTLWCEGEAYLFYLLDFTDYYIGAWGRYGSFYRLSDNDDEVQYCYTATDGTMLSTQEGEFLNLSASLYTDSEGTEWYVTCAAATEADFFLVRLIEREGLEAGLSGTSGDILLAACIFALLMMAYLICIYRWVVIPIGHLRKSMDIIQSGDIHYRIPALKSGSQEFDAVTQEFNHLMDHIEDLRIKMYESRMEQNEVRLQYLSRQIQPHFILNTLNTLYNYSDRDVRTAKEIILLTSRYYRYVVNVDSRYVPLGEELEHIENYLRLQKIRFPAAFQYEIECEDALKIVPVPPFILESFVGNAVKHGIRPGEMSEIRIEAQELRPFCILIRISDTGDGFSEDSLDAVKEFLEEGKISEELGVGIRNSVERLRLIYEGRCVVRVYNQKPHGAVVEMEMVLQEEMT